MRGNNINLSYGLHVVYEDAQFQINKNDKVGIIGANGAGKTTLFRVLLKKQELDGGRIEYDNARIGYLPQEIALDDNGMTVLHYLQSGRPISHLEHELNHIYSVLESETGEQEQLLERMMELQEQLEYYECYQAEYILLEIVEKMQIDKSLLEKPLAEVSGGQKSKIAFARVLYSNPEILLLDEPTNHLDQKTKNFVMQYLKSYQGMVLIISHDLDFLNDIIGKVLFINHVTHKISVYEGNYHTYQQKYTLERRLREQKIIQQEKEIKELSDFVRKAKQASQTNHHLKRLGHERAARLEKKQQELLLRERAHKRVKIDIRLNRECAKIPLAVENLTFGYCGQTCLYQSLYFSLQGKERFLVVGDNGAGKSTLLKLLVGILQPQQGRICRNPKTDIAYYAQEMELLDREKRVLDNVETPGYTQQQLRTILGNFLFHGDDVFQKVDFLSPGERARIALCKVLLQKANLLVLDEPTNHLDPETQKVIGENFNHYPGTMIVVSHNLSFVEQIGINRMLHLPSGRMEPYSRERLARYRGPDIAKF